MIYWTWQPVPFSFVMEAIRQTIRGAGLVDFLDIAVVTLLIYFAFRWIQRARAIRVLQGIAIVCLLYAAARQTGLGAAHSGYGPAS